MSAGVMGGGFYKDCNSDLTSLQKSFSLKLYARLPIIRVKISSTAIKAHRLPTFKSHSTASGNAFEKNLCIKSFAFSFGVMG